MKNKLLLTSALAGVVALAGSAFAETKVSGNLEFVANGAKAVTPLASTNGEGFEENIRIDASRDIALGKFSYGFNIENGATEGAYMQVGNGGLVVQIGTDSFMNLSNSVIPNTGESYQTVAANIGDLAYETSFDLGDGGASAAAENSVARKDVFGLGISKTSGGNTVGFRYTPNTGRGNTAAPGDQTNTGTSTMKLMFMGDMGVPGLKIAAGYAKDEASQANTVDGKAKTVGIAYTAGKFSAGAQRKIFEPLAATTAAQDEFKTNEFGIGYVVSDNLSVSAVYIQTDGDNAGTNFAKKETITGLGIGYNLGGIAVELSYADVQNVGGTNGQDGESYQIRTVQKF